MPSRPSPLPALPRGVRVRGGDKTPEQDPAPHPDPLPVKFGEGDCCCFAATAPSDRPEAGHRLTLHQSFLAMLIPCSEVRPHLQGQWRPRVMSCAVGGIKSWSHPTGPSSQGRFLLLPAQRAPAPTTTAE